MSADRWGDDQLFEEAAQLTRAHMRGEIGPSVRAELDKMRGFSPCRSCGGAGQFSRVHRLDGTIDEGPIPCPDCYGTGRDGGGSTDAPDLPRALAELRDNEASPPPNAGAARARRIEAIKTEIAACQAFIDDCDRMADDLKTTSCTGSAVPMLMRGYLLDLRAGELDRKCMLEAERDAKRGAG